MYDATKDIQLTDMYESYLPQSTPGYQTYISKKQEFSELASYPNEEVPRSEFFSPFVHQKFTHRLLRAVPGLFIISETGSGKSCEVIGFIEIALDELKRSREEPGLVDDKIAHFKRVVVLVKNPTLMLDFHNQVACKCSDGRYLTDNLLRAVRGGRKKVLKTTLEQAGYTIRTYQKFAKEIEKKIQAGDDSYIDDYSDTIFWIDEAHNLSSETEGGKAEQKERTYYTLLDLFGIIQRSKVIISTATPMINNTAEMIKLINLIPGPRMAEDFDLDHAQLQDVEPYFRGRISFIRAPDTGVLPTYQENPANPPSLKGLEQDFRGENFVSKTITYGSIMSPFQNYSYGVASSKSKESGDTSKEEGDSVGFYLARRQAGNFVFPDARWGGGPSKKQKQKEGQPLTSLLPMQAMQGGDTKHAFGKFVLINGDRFFPATNEFREYLRHPELVALMSCKYATIIELLKQPGNAFIYEEEVTGSGAGVLGLCLEGAGYDIYDENESVFISANEGEAQKYCAERGGNVTKTIKPTFLPKPRYCLYHGGVSPNKFASMIECFNSYENRHGDYIKAFISTRVGRDGMNLSNVLQIHIGGGMWNESGTYQALSRAIRATSHVELIKEMRQSGQLGPDEKLVIKIYKHAAIPLAIPSYPKLESVDFRLYLLSEAKDKSIQRILTFMKQCAVGCQVHYHRNVREGDEGDEGYVCSEGMEGISGPRDYSTYNVFYAKEAVPKAVKEISELFKTQSSLTINQVYEALPQYRNNEYVVASALETMINDNVPILDRYGYNNYLDENNGVYFLVNTYPSGLELGLSTSYYTQNFIGLEKKSLNKVQAEIAEKAVSKLIPKLEVLDPRSYDFIHTIESLDMDSQVRYVEDSVVKHYTGQSTPAIEAVIAKFKPRIFYFEKPIGDLNKIYSAAGAAGPRPGPVPTGTAVKRETTITPVMIQDVIDRGLVNINNPPSHPIIFLHIMYIFEQKQTAHGAQNRINEVKGRMRILDTSSQPLEWKDVQPREKDLYRTLIIAARRTAPAPISTPGVSTVPTPASLEEYGGVKGFRSHGSFSIIDQRRPSEELQNKKYVASGKVCTSFSVPDLHEIAWYLRLPLPPGNLQFLYTSPDQVRNMLDEIKKKAKISENRKMEISREPFEEIYYKYRLSSLEAYKYRNDLCDAIEAHMMRNGLIRQQ